MFAAKIDETGLSAPSIGMVILNRSTQYNQKASKAFGAMFEEIRKRTRLLLEHEPRARGTRISADPFYDIPDTHSVAIVSSHFGLPIRLLEVKKYKVFDETPQVNPGPLDRYREAIADVVAHL